VLVLGAGFSIELSAGAMPTTDELGNLVRDRYLKDGLSSKADLENFHGGLFETWLSRLADDQPYLFPEDNLNNQARFVLYSEYLAEALEDRVKKAVEAHALSTAWLPGLLGCLHARRATVLTFNQDTLIERAVTAAQLRVWDQSWWLPGNPQPKVSWYDVQTGAPPPARGTWEDRASAPSFRLVKLHGSTNWYWYPNDRTGATMATWWLRGTAEGESCLPNEDVARQRLLPGRKPFIVPPSATKSAYYDNPVTVQLWRYARQVLARPSVHVSLIGYSLPPTDLVTANLFRDTLVERVWAGLPTVQIDVANIDCASVCKHLRRLDIEQHVTRFDSIGAFAAAYLQRAATELAAELVLWKPSEQDRLRPVAVGLSMEHSMAVGKVKPGIDGDCELALTPYPRARPYSPVGQPLRAWADDFPAPVTVGELMDQLSVTKRVVAVKPDGARTYVVGAAATPDAPGVGIPGWQILIPAEDVGGNQPGRFTSQ
jgi:hypothetical protein